MLPRRRPVAPPRARLRIGVAVLACLAAGTVSAGASTPTPSTPTLPVPADTLSPQLSVGGPRLASTGLVLDAAAGVPAPPAIRDVAWVLADLDTGEVLAARAPHARLRPASTLKVLTALTLLPRLDPGEVVTATAADANADGSRVGLVPGGRYTVNQLFQGLLLASGNDAAYALARTAGGTEQTLARMNADAARLGAHDTVAKDPSGLDVGGQTTSAYDLALIARAALEQPLFRTYVATRQVTFPGKVVAGKRQTFMVQNHNRLLFNYDGTIGVKNGYTEKARRTFVSAVTRGGRTLVLTELYSLESSWRPQAAVYDWGFRYADQLTPVGTLVEPGAVPVAPRAAAAAATPTGPDGEGSAAGDGAVAGSGTASGAGAAAGADSGADPGADAVVATAFTDRSDDLTLPTWVPAAGGGLVLLAGVVVAGRSRRTGRGVHRGGRR